MYSINIGENNYKVEPSGTSGKINGSEYEIDLVSSDGEMHIIRDNQSYRVFVAAADYTTKTFEMVINGVEYTVQAQDKFDLLLKELGMENMVGAVVNELKAPMPGLVIRYEVKPGDEVKKGDALMVLEAMKMENVLKAPSDAMVKSVNAEIGQAVEKNQVLIEFE